LNAAEFHQFEFLCGLSQILGDLCGRLSRVLVMLLQPKGTCPVIPSPTTNCLTVNLLLTNGQVGSDFGTLVLTSIIAL
jgi:hypothetical protein